MSKEQEQTKLNELINVSGIAKSIAVLEALLSSYQERSFVVKYRYDIGYEFADLITELRRLKDKLEGLVEESVIWELE